MLIFLEKWNIYSHRRRDSLSSVLPQSHQLDVWFLWLGTSPAGHCAVGPHHLILPSLFMEIKKPHNHKRESSSISKEIWHVNKKETHLIEKRRKKNKQWSQLMFYLQAIICLGNLLARKRYFVPAQEEPCNAKQGTFIRNSNIHLRLSPIPRVAC